ncbi:Retrovirus-related Pol polyprotein from transposon [Dictyocoela muelleri]|nr:Retrovirus-related Pol polyprotein from transposon [Dictyocoela muelleri]
MGYHQIEMDNTSIKYTSFIILIEQYEYLRMPFGLNNAPRSFQRTMLSILGDLKYVKVYLDDVLVHTKKDENHKNHVIEVIKRLNDAGMTINLKNVNSVN